MPVILREGKTDNKGLIDVLMLEYKQLSDEIQKRVEYQQRMLNYNIILTGIIITASIKLLDFKNDGIWNDSIRFFLLIAPVLYYFLSWASSRQDLMIISIANYLSIDLKNNLINVINFNEIFNWESFINKERRMKLKNEQRYAIIGEESFLLLPIIMTLIYLIWLFPEDLFNYQNNIGNSQMFFLFLIISFLNILLFLLTFKMRINIAKKYMIIGRSVFLIN